MIYVPERFDVNDISPATLDEVLKRSSDARFWYEFATKKGFAECGKYCPTLHGGKDASKSGIPLSLLAETIAKEVRRGRDGLRAYGERKRKFKSETHRLGQRAIDALECQVLLPIGARFVPPEDGCEGGAEDRSIVFADGTRKSAQIKKVHLDGVGAGFYAAMYRHDGSIRREDGSTKMCSSVRTRSPTASTFSFSPPSTPTKMSERIGVPRPPICLATSRLTASSHRRDR